MSAHGFQVRQHKRSGARGWLIGILLVGAALLIVQQQYIRHHLPRIATELAAADAEGVLVFDAIGLPPGAEASGRQDKRYPRAGRRSMWRGVDTAVEWRRSYEVPGDFMQLSAWYRDHLLAAGWEPFDGDVPSSVQREYRRGKWQLKVMQMAFFERPTRTHLAIALRWGYWHRTD